MPTAIIAGLPLESERRVRSELKKSDRFPDLWRVTWLRSNGRVPGLAASQLNTALQTASDLEGAHFLIFHGRDKREEDIVVSKVSPYFRMRWIDQTLLRLIPHSLNEFFEIINRFLGEELEWAETVKPRDESYCLLLPQCAFSAEAKVAHLWTAATEAGIERVRLAARASKKFETTHWLPRNSGPRAWIDTNGRVFDHRGARHGLAPFPRGWKFSYQVVPGFHFDVTSNFSRPFHVDAVDGRRHAAIVDAHINIDPHGYVR
jgi:hypothetical protein